jgi:hypothetical protein
MHHSPSIAPSEPDYHDVYLVLNDFGAQLGRAWPEADEGRTNREIVITDLMTGQYSDPVRVVAFNTAEGWSSDVSEDIADELSRWYAEQDREIPPRLEAFIERHRGAQPVQLPLPLRGAV